MVKGSGIPRIDGVAIGEVSINLLSPTVHLAAKYALVNSQTAERFGAGNRNSNWSDATLTKLGELIEAMENDVCMEVFSGVAAATGEEAPTMDGVPEPELPNQMDEDQIPSL